jgi:hypothetical protein
MVRNFLGRIGLFAFAVAATAFFAGAVLYLLALDALDWAAFKINNGWKAKRAPMRWL